MKIALVAFAVFGVVAATAAGALASGWALATSSHQATTTKTVKIVMHDPGCHWFMVHGQYKVKDTVKANRVRLVDQDEAGLIVKSPQGVRHIPFGKSIVVGQGVYRITMVGQAPDDNHLRLTVN
jgi:hypothetical protein